MENKSELIRQQMSQTRTDLTDKLERLEYRVVDTAEVACSVAADTVGTVKVIVHDSLQTVKESVHEAVETMRDAFDLQRHVEQRPWTTLAGATALGYLGGYFLCTGNRREAGVDGKSQSLVPAINAPTAMGRNAGAESRAVATSAPTHQSEANAPFAFGEPSWLSRLGATFHEEISELKGLAVGALFGIVRDVVIEKTPASAERQVEELINNISIKLGGQPIVDRDRDDPIDGFAATGTHGYAGLAQHGDMRKRSTHQDAMARANGRGIE